MKIALICPSNMLFMPYVKSYEQILDEQHIDYDIINWDRFQMEEEKENTYKDNKIGHHRNFFEYLKFRRFVIERLRMDRYNKIVVFGIQLAYLLHGILKKKFKGAYVLDIRDFHKLHQFFNIKKTIEGSAFTVISSPGFEEWLPHSKKYITNHNTQIKSINEIETVENMSYKEQISVANIGALRDFSINKDFISVLKNNRKFVLNYYGEGNSNQHINDYLVGNQIRNVRLTGRYYPEEEEQFYHQNDFINVLRYNDGINNKTALPNRLYNALIYGKPLIAFKGTYLAEIISLNHIGVVLHSFEFAENDLLQYASKFNSANYYKGRKNFLEKVLQDNILFEKQFKTFIRY
ncbi:hypothetical protein [Solibacillus daqui]|uniref:hypothetical protein n=1 Tax=Solibacillus daqui TaxID=2912187 RepID=UPI002365FBCB|nr:hypothetical protein [Solibacillus daqui]